MRRESSEETKDTDTLKFSFGVNLGPMKKTHLAGILVAITMITIGLTIFILLQTPPADNQTQLPYTYEVIHIYPHDPTAFTEGLIFQDGMLYEGTGLYGESRLQKTTLETGNITQSYAMGVGYFGEGITIIENRIIQLTWLENTGFVYDRDTFQLLSNFSFIGEGWGITTDGQKLIMSNGSATLTFLDPHTFQAIGTIDVRNASVPVPLLNELEYINGDIYANVYGQKQIAIINIQTGQVEGWVDLNGLTDPSDSDPNNVLNGIAYDPNEDRLFITGKRWTQLFEIELISTQ